MKINYNDSRAFENLVKFKTTSDLNFFFWSDTSNLITKIKTTSNLLKKNKKQTTPNLV